MNREDIKSTSNPKLFWKDVAEKIGGDLKVTKQNQNFGELGYDYYHLWIYSNYKGVNILIHSTYKQSPGKFAEYYLSDLRITSEITNHDDFYLYLWRKGCIERLFSIQKRTGNKDFDRIIGYKTNNERNVFNFFSNKVIRDLLIGDSFSVFNIQNENGIMNIKLQTGLIIKDKSILLKEIEKYIIFLDGLIASKLITPG